MRLAARWLAIVALAGSAAGTHAHDSWLRPAGKAQGMELTTGNRFPVGEVGSAPDSVVRSGCRAASAKALSLRAGKPGGKALPLLARGGAPIACWAELAPAELEMEERLVGVYFAEIQASPALREAWAGMQARGLPWRERYRKFARIEIAAPQATAAQLAAARRPVGLDLELRVLGDRPIGVGEELEFELLRNGLPFAGLPVEAVSERSPLGLWQRTDENGRLRLRLPFGGHWLLRAVDLRLDPDNPDRWDSRFVTLAIDAR